MSAASSPVLRPLAASAATSRINQTAIVQRTVPSNQHPGHRLTEEAASHVFEPSPPQNKCGAGPQTSVAVMYGEVHLVTAADLQAHAL